MNAAATAATRSNAVRQSYLEINQAASGDIVNGAIPIPAETSDTARLRCVSNHPATVAIIGTKTAEAEAPTSNPKISWNWTSEVDWLASATPAASAAEPMRTTGRGP